MSSRATQCAAALMALVLTWPVSTRADPNKQDFEVIGRGRYLARVGDCTACHTAPDGKLFAGGRPIETPFGIILTPNITPDTATGIGAWSEDEFVNSLQRGTGRNGKHLYPAMPYTYYTKVTRDDVLAIRAYLATVEPVRNEVVSNQLPFPFNIRASLIAWNMLFFKPGIFRPEPGKSPEWNRGAYLTEGLAHCGMCHTPKNFLGADQTDSAYQGYALQGWFAPNLSGARRVGLGQWSAEDIVLYLKTGRNRFDIASGPMAEAVRDSTSHMTTADLRAIATYLKDLPAARGSETEGPVAATDPAMQAGEAVFVDQCASCHTKNGGGIVGLFPTLKDAPVAQQANPASLIRVVLHGSRAAGTPFAPTAPAMPAFGWTLTDAQAAAVLTYIRNSWGNVAPAVSPSEVQDARATRTAGAN